MHSICPGPSPRRSLVAILGGVIAVIMLMGCDKGPTESEPTSSTVSDTVPEPPEKQKQWTADEVTRLTGMKNRAIGLLENGKFQPSIAILKDLSKELPDEPLVCTNLAVAYLLMLKSSDMSANRQSVAYREAIQEADNAVRHLQEIVDSSANAHILASKVARLIPDEERSFRELNAAAELSPDDPVVWYEMYQAERFSDDPKIKANAIQALKRAYELKPDNLFVLKEWLLQQATEKDPEIIKTLTDARKTLAPFVEKIQQLRRVNLNDFIDKAAAALQDDSNNPRSWSTVMMTARLIGNLLIAENATRIDFRRIDRLDEKELRELEFLMHDFSDAFHSATSGVTLPAAPAIPVELKPMTPSDDLANHTSDTRDFKLVDFDLDARLDIVAVRHGTLDVLKQNSDGSGWSPLCSFELKGDLARTIVADLDRDALAPATKPGMEFNNTDCDVIAFGPAGIVLLENRLDAASGTRSLVPAKQTEAFSELKDVLAVEVVDLDQEGDLDLVISTAVGLSLWLNRGDWTFEDISTRSLLPPPDFQATSIVPVDWNRNVDVDVILSSATSGRAGYLENLRHGRFRWQSFSDDYAVLDNARVVRLAELDGNVSWDLISCGANGVSTLKTTTSAAGLVHFLKSESIASEAADGVCLWDYDNDGATDLLTWGASGLRAYRGDAAGEFELNSALIQNPPAQVAACDVGDLDGDGDWDLAVATTDGLVCYENAGGSANRWLDIQLRAETNADQFPHLRTNMHGIGSLLEVKTGTIYQAQIVTRPTMHFGLGGSATADVARIVWTNGIPSSRVEPEQNQTLYEQQDLKGSCPYLYTWTGEKYEFFTDLLWAAPIGLQVADGVTMPSRAWEYLRIPGDRLVEKDGEYRMQVTEELWEAGYFDSIELLAVDHPAEMDIYSNEKVGPAELAAFKIHTVRTPHIPVAARDQTGRDVLPLIAERDEVYLRAFGRRILQGLTDTHYVELDLGRLDHPKQVTLFLTGWIFPTDTSLNVAISQNPRLKPPRPPAVWVPDQTGTFQEVVPFMGFPGGKTKTIAVDLSGIFLTDDYRVRVVTSAEICWDAAFFTVDEAPGEFQIKKMPLLAADLHDRGYSLRIPHPANGPVTYDYSRVSTMPNWPPMDGYFTRFGDVTDLIRQTDDLLVVLGASDEMTVRFQASDLPLKKGWKRDFILHNVGWDKDADLNTIYGQTVEPLPFEAMNGYPDVDGKSYPTTPEHEAYRRTYQTRVQNRSRFWRYIRDYPGTHPAP